MRQPDASDAVGDDVHDALTTGCSAPDHQDGGAYLEAKLLEHGGPYDDRRVFGLVFECQEDGVGGGMLATYH